MAVGALALGAGLLVGVSGASSPSVDVDFTPLVPPKKVLSNASIGANATKVVVVSGGTTTVPSNATTVQLAVTAKGSQAGTMSFHPHGNPSGSSGQTVSWPAGGSGTATIATDVGQKNSIGYKNASSAGATVTVTITGYSTEVEVDDISGSGGSAGQVLTNTGNGAAWQDTQLPAAYHARNPTYITLAPAPTSVTSVVLPAGRYQVEAVTTGYAGLGAGYFSCSLISPGGGAVTTRYGNLDANIFNTTMVLTGLVHGGGTVALRCAHLSGAAPSVYESSILATRVGVTSGPIVADSPTGQRVPRQPGR